MLVTVAAVGGIVATPSFATTRKHTRPVVLRGVLHRGKLTHVADVAANDRFVYTLQEVARTPITNPVVWRVTATLTDRRTGKRTAIHPGSCVPGRGVFGGPWLLIGCSSGPALRVLYDVVDRRTHSLSAPFPCEDPNSNSSCELIAVGRRWIAVADVESHGVVDIFLQSVADGQVSYPRIRPGGATTFDLDSVSGVRPLCQPLRYPNFGDDNLGPQPGWLQMLGRFALAGPAWSSPRYLERCGSRTRVPVGDEMGVDSGPLAGDSQIVVWLGTPYARVSGVWLPSFRQFSIPLPSGFSTLEEPWAVQIAVSQRTIYIRDSAGVLWHASLPASPSS